MRFKLIILVLLFIAMNFSLKGQKNQSVVVISEIEVSNDDVISDVLSIRDTHNKEGGLVLVIMGGKIKNTSHFDKIIANFSRLKDKFDRVYLIPGSMEWDSLGAQGVKLLDDKFQDEFDQDILIPDNACGEVETKDLTDDIVLAAMDSKWYLQNWESDNYVNKGCEIRDRSLFWRHFSSELAGHKDKIVLLFTYHPPVRFDKSSGHYPLSSHLLPLPLIGTLMTHLKAYTKGYESATNPRYKTYSNRVTGAINLEPNVISISGEGKYQMDYLDSDGYFVNVNSGQANGYIPNKSKYWSHNKPAYLHISFLDNKQHFTWHRFPTQEPIYQRKISVNREIIDTVAQSSYDRLTVKKDSMFNSIFEQGDILDLGDFLFGKLNTDIYYTPVKAPVLDLSNFEGGVDPIRIGGGRQTRSVRLQGEDDNVYVIRSLRKTPSKLLQPPFDIAPLENVISYFFTASNPYGFLVSSRLEESLGLYRTNPQLMYLPRQKKLQPYNDEVGDRLVLQRLRADGDKEDIDFMGNSPDIISSSDLIEEYQDNKGTPDPQSYLKARLLDMVLNDWDRHEDQWRWAKDRDKNDEVDTYYPIPRDRDQALSNYDGFLLGYIRQFAPSIFQLRPFDENLSKSDIVWMHYLATYLDKLSLTQLSYEEWSAIAAEMKMDLTQRSIESAVANLPKELNQNYKKEVIQKLSCRRDQLPRIAKDYYRTLNEKALVIGSTKEDSVTIEYKDQFVTISLYALDGEDEYFTKFKKTFDPKVTKEIWIFTLGAKDKFITLNSSGSSSIRIRLMGGYGEDNYIISSPMHKNISIYDLNDNNIIESSGKVVIADNKELVSINRKDFMKNYSWILPQIGFNSDDGTYLGLTYSINTFGFKSDWVHNFSASIATERQSTAFNYKAVHSSQLNNFNKFFELSYFGPRYENNFYGFGNNSIYDSSKPNSYYFTRMKKAKLEVGLIKNNQNISNLEFSISATRNIIENIDGRLLNKETYKNPDIFNAQYFAGAKVKYNIHNFDSSLKPHNGLGFDISLNGQKHLSGGQMDHILFETGISLFKSIGAHEQFVYATNFGYTKTWGNLYFYQSPSIGGDYSLRGFRRDRFYGEDVLYHSNDLYFYAIQRRDDNDKRHSVGLTISFDYGRVWSKEDLSKDWHYNYGIGLFFSPLDVAVISGTMFFSKEDKKIEIGMGWPLNQ